MTEKVKQSGTEQLEAACANMAHDATEVTMATQSKSATMTGPYRLKSRY